MKAMLGDKYYIESDRNQFVLYQIRPKGSFPGVYEAQEGETTDEVVGYYSTFKACLKAIPDRILMRSNASSIKDALFELERYRLLIESAIKEIK